jgi:hypothetical protein
MYYFADAGNISLKIFRENSKLNDASFSIPTSHAFIKPILCTLWSITFHAIFFTVVSATSSMPRGYIDDSFSTREALQQPHSRSEIVRAKKADGRVVIELNIELHRKQSKWK